MTASPTRVAPKAQPAISTMILSSSGWRGIFAASGGEEDRTGEISEEHKIIAEAAASEFAGDLYKRSESGLRPLGSKPRGVAPLVLVGCDTRPTGKAIAEAMITALLSDGCRVQYAGVVAAPEIMAWARSLGQNETVCGFIYISASHNPIGHNGFKFGLSDGGILPPEKAKELADKFRPEEFTVSEKHVPLYETFAAMSAAKKAAYDAYYSFSEEVAWNHANIADALKRGIAGQPLGVCCDFNGSARCVSIDKEFFEGLGIRFKAINDKPGEIVHRIVPEGESLDPCCAFLEEQHHRDPSFVLGYVPDCDGDRGNLVIWNEELQKARALEAQEVFALACIAELAQLAWAGGIPAKTAVAVNDPTSLRIDHIAAAFGVSVFRAEVGEANVVGLARRLREEGYTVRILGEGSAGGNITHPSAVRDPLHTVLAIAKLLSVRTGNNGGDEGGATKGGLFEIWCNMSAQTGRYHPNYNIADIIASLPQFATTGAYSPEAVLTVASRDHSILKSRYQAIFLREWENRKEQLKTQYGIYSWEAAAYNGMEERKDITNFGEAGKGGLKICFYGKDGSQGGGHSGIAVASIWMRGSATEPVFRIMADAADTTGGTVLEHDLIQWQRRMVMEADNSRS